MLSPRRCSPIGTSATFARHAAAQASHAPELRPLGCAQGGGGVHTPLVCRLMLDKGTVQFRMRSRDLNAMGCPGSEERHLHVKVDGFPLQQVRIDKCAPCGLSLPSASCAPFSPLL